LRAGCHSKCQSETIAERQLNIRCK
jgi:hypothetical protein